ncbi:MAG TPA: sulfate transporter CysZ [Gammaproteobacteria bacterium]|nr:sulfate transporter CysZ [Gammaproteobacteria bacterium]
MRDFLLGVSYLPRGFRLLWEPSLRRYVVGPIAINIVVFALLFWFAGAQFQQLLAWLLPDPEAFAGGGFWQQTLRYLTLTLYWLLWPLFVLIGAVVMFYTFTLIANLLGSPFNGFLAARVEQLATGAAPPEQNTSLAAEVWLSVTGELRKYAYFLKLALPLLVLFLIPGVNLIASLLWALFGAWAIALEYLDYPMGNHGHRFNDERRLLARRRPLALGFGAAVLAMTLIPGLNLLAMPTGVIAATLLWTEQRRRITGEELPLAQPPS